MQLQQIKTENDYATALKRMVFIMDEDKSEAINAEIRELAVLIEAYEDRCHPIS